MITDPCARARVGSAEKARIENRARIGVSGYWTTRKTCLTSFLAHLRNTFSDLSFLRLYELGSVVFDVGPGSVFWGVRLV